jgi:hypothetical protein
MLTTRRTIILSDGGLSSLVACCAVGEELALAGVAPAETHQHAIILPAITQPAAALLQHKASAAQADLFGLGLCGQDVRPLAHALPQADADEREAVELLGALLLAARLGCERVLWPVSAGAGESVDIDRLAQITERSLAAARLASASSGARAAVRLVVDTPYAELSDRQLADLALDMGVPLASVWWSGGGGGGSGMGDAHGAFAGPMSGDPAIDAERRRWAHAFEAAGWATASN